MATAAQKLQFVHQAAAQEQAKAHPMVTIKTGRKKQVGPAELAELVFSGHAIKTQLDSLKGQLAEINEQILGIMQSYLSEAGIVHVLVDGVDCTIALRDSVSIEDVGGLRELLGDCFPSLVKEKTSFAPESKLVAMALDADDPRSGQIALCLSIQEARASLTYKTA